jgi:hypothetical protein
MGVWMFRKAGPVAALALLLAGTPGIAKNVQVAPGDPPITAEVPNGWATTRIDRGIQIKSADEEVYLWFETYAPASFDAVMGEHRKYFAGQGVKIVGAAKTSTKTYPALSVELTDFPAEWQGKPTVMRYILLQPNNPLKKRILASYWASPEGDKTHDGAMTRLMESFRESIAAAN